MKSVIKITTVGLIISMSILILQCEGRTRFYRPDLPEQLCAIGIIDIDDTTIYDITFWWHHDTITFSRSIQFERSYQREYSDGLTDSLRDFKFRISNEYGDMFIYNTRQPTWNPEVKIPLGLSFESGKKYFFHGSEKNAPDISAEITLPELPPPLTLLSCKDYLITLKNPSDSSCHALFLNSCDPDTVARTSEIEFSFPNLNPNSYYAVLLIGNYSDSKWEWGPGRGSNFLNFSILESNTYGFFSDLHGRRTFQVFCPECFSYIGFMENPVRAYFIDGSKIPAETCTLKLLTEYANGNILPDSICCFQVRLMSIPEEAYLFYKSLYTYNLMSDDPFRELVNINGNVVGGNGIIALCRSRDLIVTISQTGKMHDPYF
ncbi:MAG TPA: DUF4249 family protein [Bacteroidales bacterium]|jgi:hypothetical protein|nr:DUF4249 family protein [Bacteroidales bacterium]OQB59631.1 MAG: hypothetical protein BWX96_02662 [Bacteroidetes bacterium ADurb.Bin145]HOU03286.1 DUF4249 family protein [Bacteroidales bacterium]HQG63005.1 DUF4249 family protein [Bacteroidales bacterium]HQK69188.1 DUF4249 family protein [Bacteroidales bacterium]